MSEPVVDADRRATGETLIEVEGLRKYYEDSGLFGGDPVKAVDGVSFEIARGETFGLVGESGCGKTTLGRTLIQLETATGGRISFAGTDVTDLRGDALTEWRRNAQMVFQDPESSLNDRMTVGEIVREPLDVHGVGTPRERRRTVRDLLDEVGLQEEHYYRYPHQFSGGQRQRIGIARALALEPEFVVLDEPVSALDVSVQAQILNLLEDLQDEFGLTYLFIAHDLSVVRHICDRVGVMYLGNLMEVGPTEQLFESPANPYTRALLSAIPEPDPTDESERITLPGSPPSPRDPPQGCPFATRCPVRLRPDNIDASEAVWDRIREFRDVVRERSRAERSLRDRVRERLGFETALADADALVAETFDDVDVPPEVRRHVEQAADYLDEGEPDTAREYLREAFGARCDVETPDYYEVDEGRLSFCHLHDPEHASPGEKLRDRGYETHDG
ncbi:oligopeptide/dipeptide ABC transporter ATP-binding protein [Halomicrobium salinisoli]|uniref:oligopeptide/dipeptide ABC transporter ATP-binding protein n=1 Tax=Halomicrobium salinisoli TaxID=2878391 RepID=UPI001CF0A3E0|nr:oligopeptide/dipeptide ABC transporter ATP-binding protein [Halomicrobium salinisoli]